MRRQHSWDWVILALFPIAAFLAGYGSLLLTSGSDWRLGESTRLALIVAGVG